MDVSKLVYHLCISSFLAIILLIRATTHANSDGYIKLPEDHVAMFVFGDSLNDPGNNNNLNLGVEFKANYSPYGNTFFKSPTGRFTDGRLILDFIAVKANLLLLVLYLKSGVDDFTNGVSFASAGSGIFTETNPGTIDLGKQLSSFKNVTHLLRKQLGDKEAIRLLNRAVYVGSIGGNDYFSLVNNNPEAASEKLQEYAQLVIGKYTEILKEVYKLGGRKFALLNIPPIGCMPYMKQFHELSEDECQQQAQEIAMHHNTALPKAMKELESQLSGFSYSIFDTHTTIYAMINGPLKYG